MNLSKEEVFIFTFSDLSGQFTLLFRLKRPCAAHTATAAVAALLIGTGKNQPCAKMRLTKAIIEFQNATLISASGTMV